MRQFSRFYVFYSGEPGPGRRYRQIVSRPSDDGEHYEVSIFEGEVVQTDPNFSALGDGAEYYTHNSQAEADKDADEERDKTLALGWFHYDPQASQWVKE
jgi:hypothetical protein